MFRISDDEREELEYSFREEFVEEALQYSSKNIKKLGTYMEGPFSVRKFEVIDKDDDDILTLEAKFLYNRLRYIECDCSIFEVYGECDHCIAVLLKMNGAKDVPEDKMELAKLIFNSIDTSNEKNRNRQLLKLDVILNFNYYGGLTLKLKIGLDKTFMLFNKFNDFIKVYEGYVDSLKFGKNFVYSREEHYFNDKDMDIINFCINKWKSGRYHKNEISFDKYEMDSLFNLLKDKIFDVYGYGTFNKLIYGNPVDISLNKEEDNYNFSFDNKDISFLDINCNYAVYKNNLYKISDKVKLLYKELNEYRVDNITLNESDAKEFSVFIHKEFNNIKIEDDIKEKFEVIKPVAKIYFDFKDNIVCKLKFLYKNKEIDYYNKSVKNRDFVYENEVYEKIKSYNFKELDNKLYISKINDQVDFIERDIFELEKLYDVYTSEKFKNTSIVKNNSISSQFSIGRDNIMTYDFNLGVIDEKELEKVFDSLKKKEKYFKLKSGDILNIEDKQLEELNEIMDTLDTYDTNGVIPKFRAIYLDSVKDYGIVKTNSLFNEFIDNFNKYKNIDINLDKEDNSILRGYQKDGVKWLYNIYKTGFGGILADEMGLGKTIQTIKFIKQLYKEKSGVKTLIVCPTSLVYNWENEFKMFGSSLNYVILSNNKDKRLELLNKNFDIYITSYGMLRQDFEVYKDFNFELIVIDEAQNIKNPKTGISKCLKSLDGNVKIALTGTPVENSIIEVWSIFDFIMPGFLNRLGKFQEKFNVKDIDEEAHARLSLLSNLIKPFILRRKKKDVLIDLPDKYETKVLLELGDKQKEVYAMQVKKTRKEFEEILANEGIMKARFKILQLLTRLRQICVDPSIVFDNYKDGSVKIEELVNTVNNYVLNGHKILLFTSFKSALDIVREKFDNEGISYYQIDGSVTGKNRNMLVNSFNKDDTNVFLITLKAGGTGLNLTSADVVIHLDLWWNPQVENQATDRAHRIGQTKSVEVIKFICKGTIEEKIVELQDKKRILSDKLIDEDKHDEMIINKLDENDIKSLLEITE